MKLENRTQLTLLREQCQEKRNKETCKILVCGGTGCLAGGSDKIFDRFSELTAGMDHVEVRIGAEIAHGEHVGVKKSGCHGFCEMGPLVRIEPYNYLYLKVKLEDCEEIFEKTVLHGEPVTRLMYKQDNEVYQTQEEIPFYAKQTRLVLKNCGAFMDRSIMEGDPHRMIEGMMIAAYAVQAQEGYIYVRAEYPLAVSRLRIAIRQAEELGILGDNILGTGFSFHLHINRGAGAFVCGEGSALTASIEGKRGMPRVKPPRTVEKGLFGKPTVLNNVETYANVPMIVKHGADWYTGIGTPESPGTKAFALTGNVNNTGLIEVPMGITLREIIFDIGGGIRDGKKFKAVQIGGPSGGCLTESQLDSKMDFDSLTKIGAMIGSGGLVVMDENTCMVEVARFFMNFTQRESCGKCVPCREGTKRMLEILERIVAGEGREGDIEELEELADMIENTALCGLGKSAPKPVISTIQAFREEYEEHIRDKKCRAGICANLRNYKINPEKCKGCSKCARNCPVGAITGKIKSPYVIDSAKCIKCGACLENCSFGAVYTE